MCEVLVSLVKWWFVLMPAKCSVAMVRVCIASRSSSDMMETMLGVWRSCCTV